MSAINFPFWSLSTEKKKRIASELKAEYQLNGVQPKQFAAWYKNTIDVMSQTKLMDSLSPAEKHLLDDLNDRPYVKPWRDERPQFTQITFFCQAGARACSMMGHASVALAAVYIHSHRMIAIASLCHAAACLYLRSACLHADAAMKKIESKIDALSWKNQAMFSSEIDNVYEKTHPLLRLYFNAQKRRLAGKDHAGLLLLKQQLSAFHYLGNFKNILGQQIMALLLSQRGESMEFSNDEQPADLNRLHAFTQKIDPLSRTAFQGLAGFGVLGLGWAYLAYQQRAYLMSVAGLIYSIFMLNAARCVHHLRVFAQAAQEADTGSKVTTLFNQAVLKITFNLISPISESTLERSVVIPFDAILKLIPAWNDVK